MAAAPELDDSRAFTVPSEDGTKVAVVHAPRDLIDGETVRAVSAALALPGMHHVAIMPDAHASRGCVVGFTARLDAAWWRSGIVPHVIGTDIGCGVAAVALPPTLTVDKERTLERIEAAISRAVPRGAALHPPFETPEEVPTAAEVAAYLAPALADAQAHADALWKSLPPAARRLAPRPVYDADAVAATCARVGANFETDVLRALGTLGGGNHFVEVGVLAEVGDAAAARAAEEERKVAMHAALREWWRVGAVRRPKDKLTERASCAKVQAAYRSACAKLGVPPDLAPLEEEEEEEEEEETESVVEGAVAAAEGEGATAAGGAGAAAAPRKAARLGKAEGLPRALLLAHSGSRHLGYAIASHHGTICAAAGGVLTGAAAFAYAADMILAQALAKMNRALILRAVLRELALDFGLSGVIDTVHNAIDFGRGIVRKGAVPAEADAPVIVALNMRDGVLLCRGKGADAWNASAPHGCGRALTRAAASAKVTMAAFKRAMRDVVTTCVCPETLDEAPQAYKAADDVQLASGDAVEVRGRYRTAVNVKGW